MATSPTTITLTPEQSWQLKLIVDGGFYASAEEAVAHSLQLLEKESTSISQYTPQVLAHLRQGMTEADRGEFVAPEVTEAFFDDWRRKG